MSSSPAVGHPPADRSLPSATLVRLAPGVRSWANASALIGGSPWRVSRMSGAARTLVSNLLISGAYGVAAKSRQELAIFRLLVDRGFAIVVPATPVTTASISTVIPAMDRPLNLARALMSLASTPDVTVVDDGSVDPEAICVVAKQHAVTLISHSENEGPAAARNTGVSASEAEFIAFLDSDCVAPPGWPASMLHHFNDPAVAAVAPRVRANLSGRSVIERFEASSSSLDMGEYPELVRPGSRLSFVPSAALIVRRSAIGDGFDEDMRMGEDVDLIWRLTDAGWHVRYDPSIIVAHEIRSNPNEWLKRRFEYGTSAAALSVRHPAKITPARVSALNLATIGLAALGCWRTSFALAAVSTFALSRQLKALDDPQALSAQIISKGVLADAAGIGHLLRREWWPIGALVLTLSSRSRLARASALCMLTPIAWEYAARRPALDPGRYLALRLVDDAAYGAGVIASCLRTRTRVPLTPSIRIPHWIAALKSQLLTNLS